jgi:hypothetical protein
MSYCRPVYSDVVVVAEVQELLPRKLRAMVCDDGVWDPEATDDVGEENYCLFRSDIGDGSDLDPFGEFVDGDQ